MKNLLKLFGIIALVALIGFSMAACSGGSGGGKNFNNTDELKAYLDKQPANTPDKPIKVAMKVNEQMFKKLNEAINSAGKYVSLNLSGSPLTTIPDGAFTKCTCLVGITIPDSVTSIGYSAFGGCTSLASVTIPNSVTKIEINVFEGCTSLASVTIPNSVTEIRAGAFSGCKSLASVTIPDSVTFISNGAFNRCENLTSVTFHGTVDIFRSFMGDLDNNKLKEGIGTYTRSNDDSYKWTKQ